jgi:hypothetical protein
MFYYKYNTSSCVITDKSDKPFPTSTPYCTSAIDLDIDLNEVIVGFISAKKELLRYTSKVRPVEDLVALLKTTREALNTQIQYLQEVQSAVDFLLMQ